jgi:hypothetical protein
MNGGPAKTSEGSKIRRTSQSSSARRVFGGRELDRNCERISNAAIEGQIGGVGEQLGR